jgi:hypothetical protein
MALDHSLFWRGTKKYSFRIAAGSRDDPKIRELRDLYSRSGVSCEVEEISCQEAERFFEDMIKRQKADLYSIKASGMRVPDQLIALSKRTEEALGQIKAGSLRIFAFDVSIDAGKVDRQTVARLLKRAKELEI